MNGIVGIDLGTTISTLARLDGDGRAVLCKTRDQSTRLESIVYVGASPPLVGEAARSMSAVEPDTFFDFFKREMGTDWEVDIAGCAWTPESLSGEVLRALADDAAVELGERPRRAVITIPAYFGDDARRATQRAGVLAGLEVVSLLHEPTAACLAFGAGGREGTVLVYDLGGGTFDASVVRFGDGGAEVLATLGDARLGGKDWDDEIMRLVADEIAADAGEDPREDPALAAELRARARQAKHTLSTLERAKLTLPVGGALRSVTLTRADLWRATATLFDRTEEIVTRLLADIAPTRPDAVVLVGGSTRMPPCRDVLVRATGLEPEPGVNPDQAVAIGAALSASAADDGMSTGARAGGLGKVREATAHALGFVVVSADGTRYLNEVMIQRHASIPATGTKRHKLVVTAPETQLEIHMLQGHAERPLDTQPLGCWQFRVPTVKRRAELQIDITYRYDADGVVVVEAATDGHSLDEPQIDRQARDLSWTTGDPRATRAAGRAPDVAVALVIDVSASMSGAKLDQAKRACREFVDPLEEVGAGDRIAIIGFGSSARTVARVGDDPKQVRASVERLSIDGSTNMSAGLDEAGRRLADHGAARYVVLLSDGAPDDRQAATRSRDRLVAADVRIITRGVSGADEKFLRSLSTEDSLQLDLCDLAGSFRGIAQQIAREDGGLRRRRA